jgi:hypothetical protein
MASTTNSGVACCDRHGSACPAVLSTGCAHRWRKLCRSGAAGSFAWRSSGLWRITDQHRPARPWTARLGLVAIALSSKEDDEVLIEDSRRETMGIEINGCIAFTSTVGANRFVCVYDASILVEPSTVPQRISDLRR